MSEATPLWKPAEPHNPEDVKLVVISECAATDPSDNYGASKTSLFDQTTLAAFAAVGLHVENLTQLHQMGVHFTTVLRHPKPAGRISAAQIAEAVPQLEGELRSFSDAKAYFLAGDVAIAAINNIARKEYGKRAIPAGSTYRIRGGEFFLGQVRLFPSYLQAGPAWFIEASKREMIAEDLATAIKTAQLSG